ncbi:hypothetical protein [Paraburkholderia dipogonis]|uniref:hypothetical protein n=1 Tax=Paraburkholderia dipogonis TaxID=1211383 RepID=UPI0038B9FFBB
MALFEACRKMHAVGVKEQGACAKFAITEPHALSRRAANVNQRACVLLPDQTIAACNHKQQALHPSTPRNVLRLSKTDHV